MTEYEYRVMGATASGFRVTDWGSREDAVKAYAKAETVDWAMIGFERREPGDDRTIHRKPRPDTGTWEIVTEDNIHVEGENVREA